MTTPTVSVCMPNYNHARFLHTSLGALLRQTYQPLEIIVVDDHSTDDSMTRLEDLAGRHPIIKLYRNERNLGVVDTVSRLTELARGDYILYTSTDDIALPRLLEKSVAVLARHPGAGLCSSGMMVIDDAGRSKGVLHHSIASRTPRYFSPAEFRALLARSGYDGWFYAGNTAIFKRAAVIEAGGFRKELHAFCDGFLATVIGLRHGLCHVPEPLGAWREVAGSYGPSSWADPIVGAEMVEAVARLVETTYPGLFPDAYIPQMRAGLRVKIRLGQLSLEDDARLARLAASTLGRSALGRWPLALLAGLLRGRYQAMNVWLRLRLGLPVGRRLVWKVKDLLGMVRPPELV